ncbi:hypothetical protein PENVUL_c101G03505 [Penicillium vulpinum]|uniref:RxLR effector protein n=1 Tax=Penicillium vulpinum TaxID=29845 RepID=A0A1V6R2Y2_9EURO|nr:hypothetical protein PENVUL_c101G03505 [Penicillium vulpinum]
MRAYLLLLTFLGAMALAAPTTEIGTVARSVKVSREDNGDAKGNSEDVYVADGF